MKKIGIIIFITTLVIGIVISSFFSLGNSFIKSPISFSFGKVQGSGNFVTERRNISDFKKIDVSGVFDVEVVAQKEFSVEVDADDNLLALIKTEISGETLSIESKKRFSGSQRIKIRVSAPDIENIDVSGASKIKLTNLDNESFSMDSSGASKINVEGKTNNLTIDTSGASRIDAKDLVASNVKIDSSGVSKINVNVTNVLTADLSGASHVNYAGSPTEINKRTSGASCLKQHK